MFWFVSSLEEEKRCICSLAKRCGSCKLHAQFRVLLGLESELVVNQCLVCRGLEGVCKGWQASLSVAESGDHKRDEN